MFPTPKDSTKRRHQRISRPPLPRIKCLSVLTSETGRRYYGYLVACIDPRVLPTIPGSAASNTICCPQQVERPVWRLSVGIVGLVWWRRRSQNVRRTGTQVDDQAHAKEPTLRCRERTPNFADMTSSQRTIIYDRFPALRSQSAPWFHVQEDFDDISGQIMLGSWI